MEPTINRLIYPRMHSDNRHNSPFWPNRQPQSRIDVSRRSRCGKWRRPSFTHTAPHWHYLLLICFEIRVMYCIFLMPLYFMASIFQYPLFVSSINSSSFTSFFIRTPYAFFKKFNINWTPPPKKKGVEILNQ